MQFKDIIGQAKLKERLLNTVNNGRISHAQLFLGKGVNGKLALAVAYGQYINCENKTETDSCGICPSCVKYKAMSHPDLFFSFPVNKASKAASSSDGENRNEVATRSARSTDLISTMFYRKWLEYLRECKYYPELQDWYKKIDIGDKQGIINVEEARRIVRDLSFKPIEGSYKVLIIWQPEKMNLSSANLLLKFFEEPPANTIIIMVSDEKDQLLPTIQSRFQMIAVPKIEDADLELHLKTKYKGISQSLLTSSINLANGDLYKAYTSIEEGDQMKEYFLFFQSWMRMCYKTGSLEEIKSFVEKVSRIGRENQKDFLTYSLRLIREALISNYGHPSLSRLTTYEAEFFQKFARFIHINNREIIEKFDKAIMEIGRNANPSVLFMSLSLDLSQLLKIKQ